VHSFSDSRCSPWLSLLVPVYNVEAWLEPCVRSMVDQGVDGIEIVLLDDVSTDGSSAVISRLVDAHPGVVRAFAHERNRGLSAARNTLLSHARGDYVWFVDSDDLLLPDALRALRDAITTGAPDLVLCDYRVVRDRFTLKHRLRGELHRRTFAGPARTRLEDRSLLVEGLMASGQLHTWSKIARRDVWQQAPFPEQRYFEDIAVIAPLVAATRSYWYVPEPWLGYRQRDDSIMRSFTPAKILHLNQSIGELHGGLLRTGHSLSRRAVFGVEYFCIKTYASLARRFARGLGKDSPEVRDACRAGMASLFPGGVCSALRGYRERGWLLREWRARRSLRRIDWLER